MILPTPEEVARKLSYDPHTGVLTWTVRAGKEAADTVAGTLNSNGYIIVTIDGAKIGAHRLAWVITYGVWPSHQIDHRNTRRTDNWLDNLRPATSRQNNINKNIKVGRSGARGVKLLPSGRYHARITVHRRQINLGCFASVEEASAAYKQAALIHHGEYARV